MARATVQDDALSESIKARGGLSQFRSVAEKPREMRDSPFGPPATKRSTLSEPITSKPVEPVALPAEPAAATKVTQPVMVQAPSEPTPVSENANTENITVPVYRSQRDRVDELARVLHRNRTVRKTRITKNTLIRVAIECLLDDLGDGAACTVNSEDELLQHVRALRKK